MALLASGHHLSQRKRPCAGMPQEEHSRGQGRDKPKSREWRCTWPRCDFTSRHASGILPPLHVHIPREVNEAAEHWATATPSDIMGKAMKMAPGVLPAESPSAASVESSNSSASLQLAQQGTSQQSVALLSDFSAAFTRRERPGQASSEQDMSLAGRPGPFPRTSSEHCGGVTSYLHQHRNGNVANRSRKLRPPLFLVNPGVSQKVTGLLHQIK